MMGVCVVLLLLGVTCVQFGQGDPYVLDDTGDLGREFDGIGGLSGGGATSRLLVSYPEKQRNEILDYLFLPNFAASLQILKVEIGGDAQTTDGTESSHMHTEDDEDYQRGYEWWLMAEAKKRNPDIKLSALSWAFPSWVGNGSGSPYTYPNLTAKYIVNWIIAAKHFHRLEINYVGIWNERAYNSSYIKTLRAALDMADLKSVEIVAADGKFEDIALDISSDPALNKAVSILGAHYPGTNSTTPAKVSLKKLWASEDFSTFNNDTGAGCWARILNQNYVTGLMTSTISWNLIASYYNGLPFFRDGLMTAIEPWSGHYDVNGPMWISAHTTQFTRPGIHYLKHGQGVGYLSGGGSYVTFYDQDSFDFTVVIETMSHNMSICIRPYLPEYEVEEMQTATFQLKGNLIKARSLNQWMSLVSKGQYFKKMAPIPIKNNQFQIDLPRDSVLTLSTLQGQSHGSYADSPKSQTFPTSYKDDFQSYEVGQEARYFADQTGVFEIAFFRKNLVMRQVVTSRPITWCNDALTPITIMGNKSWVSMNYEVMAKLEDADTAVFLGGGVSEGGCSIAKAEGIFAFMNSSRQWMVTSDIAMQKVLGSGVLEEDIKLDTWYKLSMDIDGKKHRRATIMLGRKKIELPLPPQYSGGFVGFGTGGFYPAQFDNFLLKSAE